MPISRKCAQLIKKKILLTSRQHIHIASGVSESGHMTMNNPLSVYIVILKLCKNDIFAPRGAIILCVRAAVRPSNELASASCMRARQQVFYKILHHADHSHYNVWCLPLLRDDRSTRCCLLLLLLGGDDTRIRNVIQII
jgi:hypothetical protein